MDLIKFLEGIPYNKKIMESFVITYDKMVKYENIMCSVSGGSDSDIVIDLCSKLDEDKKITYVFFDTGLEYEATKEHLKYIEETYQIQIHRIKGKKTVPLCCKTYGQPFLSKQVSEWIERLQRHNFQWENEPLEILLNRYPGCRAALRWWCNDFANREDGRISSYNIGYNKYLKEFMVQHPPEFRISNKCCHFAKKNVALRFKKEGKFDLSIVGVRKAEGGARSTAYTSCFSAGEICEHFSVTGASISRHLAILKEADLIRNKREGKFIYYELNTSVLEDVMLWIIDLKGVSDDEGNDKKI